MSIGNNIRNIRKEKGITLQQIADVMGCSPQLISQYENGKRIPKIENIRKIAAALGVYISDLVDDWEVFSKEDISKAWETENATPELSHETAIKAGGYKNLEESSLLDNYRQLNTNGQTEARKRVQELTEIKRYTEPDEPPAE